MPGWAVAYVRWTEAVNYRIGRAAMLLLFVIMGVLLWSSASKYAGRPSLWTMEMAQFLLVAYYLLGAPYSMQLGANVRMDLLYARLPARRQAGWDAVTVLFLLFYLGVMLWGAVASTAYSFEIAERAPSAWRPPMWPVKLVATIGLALLLLQALAHLVRDIATLRGVEIPSPVTHKAAR